MSENAIALDDGYKDAYCFQLEEHLATGLSLESFVGVVCEDLEVIQGWIKKYPDFAKSYRIGEAKARLFYERLGLQGMMGVFRGFNANTFRFLVEERFKMGKPPEVNDKGGGKVNITVMMPDNGRNGANPRVIESQTLNALVEDADE